MLTTHLLTRRKKSYSSELSLKSIKSNEQKNVGKDQYTSIVKLVKLIWLQNIYYCVRIWN